MAQLRLVDDDGLTALLDNSNDTLVRWRIEGRGPRPIRVARMMLYDLDDVREWLLRHRDEHEVVTGEDGKARVKPRARAEVANV